MEHYETNINEAESCLTASSSTECTDDNPDTERMFLTESIANSLLAIAKELAVVARWAEANT